MFIYDYRYETRTGHSFLENDCEFALLNNVSQNIIECMKSIDIQSLLTVNAKEKLRYRQYN